eukprot:526428-Prorocentrum_minimum.AAC.2
MSDSAPNSAAVPPDVRQFARNRHVSQGPPAPSQGPPAPSQGPPAPSHSSATRGAFASESLAAVPPAVRPFARNRHARLMVPASDWSVLRIYSRFLRLIGHYFQINKSTVIIRVQQESRYFQSVVALHLNNSQHLVWGSVIECTLAVISAQEDPLNQVI